MEKYITELLNNNVRVVLPDLGAFIVKQRKPLKIIFNEFLKYNDGLLIEYIAKSGNISKEEATKQVTEYIDSVKEKLDKSEKITISGLGILNKDQAGNIAFDLAKDTQISTETTIKTDKKAKDKEETKEVKKTEVTEEKKEDIKKEEPKKEVNKPPPPPPSPKKDVAAPQMQASTASQPASYTSNRYTKKSSDEDKKRIWLWLIAAVMAILIVVLILNINKTSKKKNKKELVKQETPASVVEEEVTPPQEEEIIEEETPPVEPETIKPVMTSSGKRYYIIAGCFEVPSNADNYVIFLRKKGYPAEKLGIINGYHVVSFNSYVSKKEALDELKVIREEYEAEAWIKRY